MPNLLKRTACPFSRGLPPLQQNAALYSCFARIESVPKTIQAALEWNPASSPALIRQILDKLSVMYPQDKHPHLMQPLNECKVAIQTLEGVIPGVESAKLSPNLAPISDVTFDPSHPFLALFSFAHTMIELLLVGAVKPVVEVFQSAKGSSSSPSDPLPHALTWIDTIGTFMRLLKGMNPDGFAKLRPHLNGISGGDSTMFRLLGALLLQDAIRITSLTEKIDKSFSSTLIDLGLAPDHALEKPPSVLILQIHFLSVFNIHLDMAARHIGGATGTGGTGTDKLSYLASLKRLHLQPPLSSTSPPLLSPLTVLLHDDTSFQSALRQVSFSTPSELDTLRLFDLSNAWESLAKVVNEFKNKLLESPFLKGSSCTEKLTDLFLNPQPQHHSLQREIEDLSLQIARLSELQFWCDARHHITFAGGAPQPRPYLFPELWEARSAACTHRFFEGQAMACEEVPPGQENGYGCIFRRF
jgi:tryptophan 2,3-dioxygenase